MKAAQFTHATEIQAATIPQALRGRDLLATAQTGTGKTLAFLIPVMQRLLEQSEKGAGALVLVPTRELGMQIDAQHEKLRGKKLPAAALLIGGASEKSQLRLVRAGARLIIATPGRYEDLLERGLIDVRRVQTVILDEADRMLDMGFIPAVRRIVSRLPRDRQTMCFSATLAPSVTHLMDDYLRNPARIAIGSTQKAHESVRLLAYEVETDQKLAALKRLLQQEPGRILVFVRTKRATERLGEKLQKHGIRASVIHGDRSQSQRNRALADFQEGISRVLLATDVASRGIHVDNIALVINYDLPAVAEDFIHRVGRTGRAGASGSAATLFTRVERADIARMERSLQRQMERISVDGDLEREERVRPVDASSFIPVPVRPGSRTMRLPGEVLQRHQGA